MKGDQIACHQSRRVEPKIELIKGKSNNIYIFRDPSPVTVFEEMREWHKQNPNFLHWIVSLYNYYGHHYMKNSSIWSIFPSSHIKRRGKANTVNMFLRIEGSSRHSISLKYYCWWPKFRVIFMWNRSLTLPFCGGRR